MPQLTKPTERDIAAFLDRQRDLPVTYPHVGATAMAPPAGWVVDHTRARLGTGDAVFSAACDAFRSWEQFDLGWVTALPVTTPLAVGEAVTVLARSFGLWWLNAARIMYVVDEIKPRRFGFAYGTLPEHAESGEERFLVEQLPDGSVWYDIVAFSRPRHPLARLGYPIVRRLQKRFARDSVSALLRAISRRTGSL